MAWLEATERFWLNPSSPYRQAAAVRVRYEAARETLGQYLHVAPSRVVFTSGATEANNAVVQAWARDLPGNALVGINPTEHPSVIEAAQAFLGDRIEWLPLLPDGRVDLAAVCDRVESGALAALSVMAANNETGVIQPWEELAVLCQRAGIPYHCDASQWLGKMAISGLGECSYVTACAHKFGGPKGLGFMLMPEGAVAGALLRGGAQEAGFRAGTEDVAGVLAMLAALEASSVGDVGARDEFIEQVTRELPGATVVGESADRLWNTVSMLMPRHQSVRWIRALEREGFLLSAGSACSSGGSTVSGVLLAMGFSTSVAGRVLRISAGSETTAADWQALAAALLTVYDTLNREADASGSTVISID
jgi:cysteine desulfurase